MCVRAALLLLVCLSLPLGAAPLRARATGGTGSTVKVLVQDGDKTVEKQFTFDTNDPVEKRMFALMELSIARNFTMQIETSPAGRLESVLLHVPGYDLSGLTMPLGDGTVIGPKQLHVSAVSVDRKGTLKVAIGDSAWEPAPPGAKPDGVVVKQMIPKGTGVFGHVVIAEGQPEVAISFADNRDTALSFREVLDALQQQSPVHLKFSGQKFSGPQVAGFFDPSCLTMAGRMQANMPGWGPGGNARP